MKRLLILRHAKSSWADEGLSDHDRPLNPRGERDAPLVGRELLTARLLPDRIVSSTARRAVETARQLAETCDYRGEIDQRRELYLASPSGYLAVMAEFPGTLECPLMVGHNPGLEELVAQLSHQSLHLPTACLVQLQLDVADWSECTGSTRGALVASWSPKQGWTQY